MSFYGYKFKYKFNASHFLDYLHPENVHTHTFHIVFFLKNVENNVIAFNDIDKNVKEYLDRFSGKCLNFVAPFDKITPTLENMCKEIYQNVYNHCESLNIQLDKLEISDNSIYWYSLGNVLLIDSLNNTISNDRFASFIKEMTQNKILDTTNNLIDTPSTFDEFKVVEKEKIEEPRDSLEEELEKYLGLNKTINSRNEIPYATTLHTFHKKEPNVTSNANTLKTNKTTFSLLNYRNKNAVS